MAESVFSITDFELKYNGEEPGGPKSIRLMQESLEMLLLRCATLLNSQTKYLMGKHLLCRLM
jgi:hypothetical protein